MLKTDYNIPIFEDTDAADLNKYSNEMANALKTQINNTNNEIKEIDKKVVDAVNKFGNPLSYKGQVSTIQDLPTVATNGDIYNVTSENKNYIYNGTNWVEYSSTLDLTYLENNTKTTQTTEVSEELTINNCAGVKGKLDIKSGKSEQETSTRGKNLLDQTLVEKTVTKNNFTFEQQENGSIRCYGNASATTSPFFELKTPIILPPGTYTFSPTIVNNLGTSYSMSCRLLKTADTSEDNNFGYNSGTTWIALNNRNKITETLTETTKFTHLFIYTNANYETDITVNFQVESGSVRTTFEQFVPNMPSPDYPSRIRNVGDNINLAQPTTNLWLNGVTMKFSDNANTYGFVAKVIPNTDYIIHKKNKGNRFIIASASAYPQNNTDVVRDIFTSNHDLTEYTFKTKDNENYIFVGVYNGTNQEEINQAMAEFKIEEGSIPTPYTPYNCGSADFKVNNKNFLNINAKSKTFN